MTDRRISKGWIVGLGLSLFFAGLFLYYFTQKSSKKPKEPLDPVITVEKFDIDFRNNVFDDGIEVSLLKELRICDSSKVGDNMGACSPKFFHFIPLTSSKPLKDAFILLINGLAFADPEAKFPIRRTLIFERERGVLTAVNKFKGNIIERRKVEGSNYDDIVIRFRLDQYSESYHVVYSWKNNRYQFNRCEELNSFYNKGKVRPELVDSVSKEVQKILVEENLVF
ncbi:MAG: hypothetical protein FJZ80_02925 [Bacteroidetes bacterium]|nr:hypothetical protein [Bacteroidota bacterium]MBM3424447.1 hypothetical protein [Bacteroidota bacterium]